MNALNSGDLRQEIGFLGSVLGETVREFAGDEAFAVIESLRRAAWDRRVGLEHSDTDPEELRHLTRLSINGIAAGMRTSG